MDLHYTSTRNSDVKVTASQAILKGLAPDGGLFVPVKLPSLDVSLDKLKDMAYQETAYAVMKQFLTDFTEEELKECISKAYDSKFDTEEIAPLVKVGNIYYLELFHGATIAFKDMALSILPHLLTTSASKNKVENEIVILTATSGDTGKAAMAGFADVEGTKIIVFYPKNGVSRVQELQMVTQKGSNVDVVAIHGNFDEAQNGVKAMFEDSKLAEELADKGYQFSSANSINIGRLVPQIVYYAKQMGVPIDMLVCASNENKVLFDFFKSGTYDRNREFVLTNSPSMDILISSNLERLIYLAAGEDAEKTRELMEELKKDGHYTVTSGMEEKLSDFAAGYTDEDKTKESIRRVYKRTGYVMDTHTAVACHVCEEYMKESNDAKKCVIASTASPYKFVHSVMDALEGIKEETDELELLPRLEEASGIEMPQAVKDILDAEILHHTECDADKMKETVKQILGLQA